MKNGAGLEHSHKHGFGLISAWRLVNAAKVSGFCLFVVFLLFFSDDLNLPEWPLRAAVGVGSTRTYLTLSLPKSQLCDS
jgi:hypothetical protein